MLFLPNSEAIILLSYAHRYFFHMAFISPNHRHENGLFGQLAHSFSTCIDSLVISFNCTNRDAGVSKVCDRGIPQLTL